MRVARGLDCRGEMWRGDEDEECGEEVSGLVWVWRTTHEGDVFMTRMAILGRVRQQRHEDSTTAPPRQAAALKR